MINLKIIMAAANVQTTAQQFIVHYFDCLDNKKPQLSSLYNDASIMNWESEVFVGKNILGKLGGFPQTKHSIQAVDVQPSAQPNAIHIVVVGQLFSIGQSVGLPFVESFFLVPSGTSYIISNQFLRWMNAL
ncbi:putative Nuclear transport factor 2 (NTF2) domain [Monocercomonoides exilis]|uniref:putative Nuclear transport factor 2 (NTF2) domain n=1 Tax=Monocercomonoides exilis TaxID=2049356 RepID=UPI003559D53B|nr:putative Nuclear transport factor 2 (NTF2) domain [Monocercomonoides exilis]